MLHLPPKSRWDSKMRRGGRLSGCSMQETAQTCSKRRLMPLPQVGVVQEAAEDNLLEAAEDNLLEAADLLEAAGAVDLLVILVDPLSDHLSGHSWERDAEVEAARKERQEQERKAIEMEQETQMQGSVPRLSMDERNPGAAHGSPAQQQRLVVENPPFGQLRTQLANLLTRG